MAGRRATIDKEVVIKLFEQGLTYRAIAENVQSNEDTIRMCIKKYAREALNEKKAKIQARKNINENKFDFIVEHTQRLDAKALKEIKEASRYGININESMSKKSFIRACFQSYKTDSKSGRVKFDTSRGARTKDVPASYEPGKEYKNTYKCYCSVTMIDTNITKKFTIKAYDNFEAEVEARKKINRLLNCEFKIDSLTVEEI